MPSSETGVAYLWPDLVAASRVLVEAPAVSVEPVTADPVTGSIWDDIGTEGPLDILAEHASWADVLGPHGWERVGVPDSATEEAWHRPGGTHPVSAKVLKANPFVLVNHSEDAGLPTGGGHKLTKGRVYAHLNFGGDVSAAATALRNGTANSLPAEVLARIATPVITGRVLTGSDPVAEPTDRASVYVFERGGNFILDTPAYPEPLWGQGSEVILPDGESLVIAGPQGVGKTTVAQQLALGRAGFPSYSELLGYPIQPGGRVLYLAMDRPKQAARSFRRMVGEEMRGELNERLAVWQGPPPRDLARNPALLLQMCEMAGADTAFVDSLKDAAIGLNDDAVGAGYNRARQTAITAGVQLVELHHNRKTLNGAKAERPTIDDLYGSTWLPSGAGSVLLLSGAPGDPIVSVHHLKQPASEVGPLRIIHDQVNGRTDVWHALDLVLLASRPGGLTAVDAAKGLFDSAKPTASEKEKARRRLDALTAKGELVVLSEGSQAMNLAKVWARR